MNQSAYGKFLFVGLALLLSDISQAGGGGSVTVIVSASEQKLIVKKALCEDVWNDPNKLDPKIRKDFKNFRRVLGDNLGDSTRFSKLCPKPNLKALTVNCTIPKSFQHPFDDSFKISEIKIDKDCYDYYVAKTRSEKPNDPNYYNSHLGAILYRCVLSSYQSYRDRDDGGEVFCNAPPKKDSAASKIPVSVPIGGAAAK